MKAPKISIQIGADTKKLKRDMKNADGIVSKFTSAAKWGLAGVASAAGAAAFTIGVEGVKAASDLGETVSKTNVIFGDTAKNLQAWAGRTANMMGQTQQQALDAASTFATFGKAAGLQDRKLLNFSKRLTVLASDLASFYNTDPTDAIQALGAALRGESEPIRRYGVLLSAAAQEQEALSMGLEVGKKGLTAQQKVMTAYSLILKQTTDAQGDFARTSDGLANGTRILEATLKDAEAAVGEALLPTIQELVKFLNSPAGKAALQDGVTGLKDGLYAVSEFLPEVIDKFRALGIIFDNITPDPNSPMWQFLDLLTALSPARWANLGIQNVNKPMQNVAPLSTYGAIPTGKRGAFSSLYGQAPINITVNGAIDPVATARQIQKLLNQVPRSNIPVDISKRSK